jgi:hypothetical protein
MREIAGLAERCQNNGAAQQGVEAEALRDWSFAA